MEEEEEEGDLDIWRDDNTSLVVHFSLWCP